MDDIIKQLAEAGVKGGTILDGTGMAVVSQHGGAAHFRYAEGLVGG